MSILHIYDILLIAATVLQSSATEVIVGEHSQGISQAGTLLVNENSADADAKIQHFQQGKSKSRSHFRVNGAAEERTVFAQMLSFVKEPEFHMTFNHNGTRYTGLAAIGIWACVCSVWQLLGYAIYKNQVKGGTVKTTIGIGTIAMCCCCSCWINLLFPIDVDVAATFQQRPPASPATESIQAQPVQAQPVQAQPVQQGP